MVYLPNYLLFFLHNYIINDIDFLRCICGGKMILANCQKKSLKKRSKNARF